MARRSCSCSSSPPYSERKRQEQLSEHKTTSKGHGRLERRHLQASSRLAGHLDWLGVKQVCRIERQVTRAGKTTKEVVYAITSLSPERASAKEHLQFNRGHWSIENKLHWVRESVMGEDNCRAKKGHSPQNLAALRNLSLTILRSSGIKEIKATIRHFAMKPLDMLKTLRILS